MIDKRPQRVACSPIKAAPAQGLLPPGPVNQSDETAIRQSTGHLCQGLANPHSFQTTADKLVAIKKIRSAGLLAMLGAKLHA
jgi:hypothetical protein